MATQQPTASDRRAEQDRRTSSERRRNADIRTPIIQIGHSMLRLAVVVDRPGEDDEVVVLRSLRWRVEAELLHSDQGLAELKAALITLASEERLAGSAAHVLLNGNLCVTRAVTGASEEVQREANLLRDRSQLYLSLGPGKKVIASSSTLLDARHSHALLTVATQQTLQVVSQAVEAAGMQLVAIESALVALARTVGRFDEHDRGANIVVQVDEGTIELGVMSGGRLFLDYRPGGHTHVDQLAELLGQHHVRLARYCQRQHGLEATEPTRVYVAGETDEALAAIASLQSLAGIDVALLDISQIEFPWEFRGNDVGPELASVVGAALVIGNAAYAPAPNLIEQLLASMRPPLSKLLAPRLAPLAAVLLMGAVFGLLNWRGNNQLEVMQSKLNQLAPQAARSDALRLELLAAGRELTQLTALGNRLAPQPISALLKNITQSIPAEVWLASLRVDGGVAASLSGNSFVESSIYDLVGHLQNVPGVAEVALQGTGAGRTKAGAATTFDMSLDLQLEEHIEPNEEVL